MNEHTLFRIKKVLHNMEAADDDISIARVTVYMAGGHKLEHVVKAEDAGDIVVLHSDEGHCVMQHHIDPKHIIGFSHIKF